MAKVTNGHSFGLNVKEALICTSDAYGEKEEEILRVHYGITSASTPTEKRLASTRFHKLRGKPGYADCYRSIVNREMLGLYSQSLKVLGQQLEIDPKSKDQGWLANKAANDIINKYHDSVMGVNSNEVVVKVEGMPMLGKPEDADGEGAESD
jgi:hypothetical protein